MDDFFERKKRIDALRSRMQEELDQWVVDNEVLGNGEKIYFTLEVVRRDSKQPPSVKYVKTIPPPPSRLIEITQTDWEKILSVDWTDEQRYIIEKLHKNNNKLTRFRYRPYSNRKSKLVWGGSSGIEYRFRKFKLPYRLTSSGSDQSYGYTIPGDRSSYFEDHYYQIRTQSV